LQVAQALPAKVECPRCKTRFVVNDPTKRNLTKDKAALIKKDRDAVRGISTRGANGQGGPANQAIRTAPSPAAAPPAMLSPNVMIVARHGRKSGGGLGILIACLVVLLLVGSGILYLVLARDNKKTPDQAQQIEPAAPQAGLTEQERRINNAVDLGVNYLRNQILNPTSKDYYFTDPGAGSNVGVLALAGLTLLECGVPSRDAAVEKVIQTVRQEAPRLTFTYSLALCILFLDRLNQAQDRPVEASDRDLIQRLAVQMMAAQNSNGGWGYKCPLLTPAQHETYLAELKAGRFRAGSFDGTYDDNSINQFATLALWAARKEGIKTEPALAMVERRYKENQNPDGSWGYRARDNGYLKDATTCAGLIGLAVGQGIRDDVSGAKPGAKAPLDPTKDPYISRGLAFITKIIGKDPRRMNPIDRDHRRKHTAEMMALNKEWQEAQESERPAIMRRIQDLDKAPLLKGTYFNADAWGDLYFLWSVERVGVIFDLKTIGGKDWFGWGAEIILNNQQKDGSWRDRFAGIPDTCFALLFLRRVNIAKDLTDKFRQAAAGLGIAAAPRPGEIPPVPPRRKE
jgi:hypothetical protein